MQEILPDSLPLERLEIYKEKMDLRIGGTIKNHAFSKRIGYSVHHAFVLFKTGDERYLIVEKTKTEINVFISSYFEKVMNSSGSITSILLGYGSRGQKRVVYRCLGTDTTTDDSVMKDLVMFLEGERERGYGILFNNCQQFAQRCYNKLSKNRIAGMYF